MRISLFFMQHLMFFIQTSFFFVVYIEIIEIIECVVSYGDRTDLSVAHSPIVPSLSGISFDLLTTSTLTTFSLKTPRTSLLPVDESCSSFVEATSNHRNQVKPRQGGRNDENYLGIHSKLANACQGMSCACSNYP